MDAMQPLLQFRSGSLTFFLQSFISLFVIVNALGNVPLFVSILERFDDTQKSVIVKKASIIAAATVLIVTVTGNTIFHIFGISMFAFTIAGGILLMIISVEMLLGQRTMTQSSKYDEQDTSETEEISVIPLAIPLLAGPGAFTTAIVLYNSADTIHDRLILLGTIVLVFAISYVILANSRYVFAVIGKNGTRVARRVMGLLLLSIAVQFIVRGIFEAVHLLKV